MNNRLPRPARLLAKRAEGLLAALVMIVAMLASSCSDTNSGDARDLLATVPSDAAGVMVINVRTVLDKTGYKVKDGVVTPPADVKATLDTIKDKDEAETLKALLAGDAGVAFSAAVCFYADQPYLTLILDDPAKTRKFIADKTGVEFVETDGVEISGDYAIKGTQLWVGANYAPRPDQINRFETLSEKQSYLSSKYADKLTALDHDFNAIADLSGLSRISGYGRGSMTRQAAQLSMIASAIFEDPSYICLVGDLDKKASRFNLTLLNDDCNPAKYLLPAGKIDAAAVKTLGGTGNYAWAIDVPSKLIKKIKTMASAFGGDLPPSVLGLLDPIDGTIAGIGIESTDDYAMLVTTTGDGTSDLTSMLADMGAVTRDGKYVKVTAGDRKVTGPITAEQAASLLKGAVAGGVFSDPQASHGVTRVSIIARNTDGGLNVEITVEGDPEKIMKKMH
ncbi:MAG: hypothetical protein K2O24_08875 [Muribaculaceae bacterium]|nr:hypothetical protein [Muribaculaceae bacterium]